MFPRVLPLVHCSFLSDVFSRCPKSPCSGTDPSPDLQFHVQLSAEQLLRSALKQLVSLKAALPSFSVSPILPLMVLISILTYNIVCYEMYFMEKEMAIHSSILAWKTSWIGEPGGLQSMGSQVRYDLATKSPPLPQII